MSRLLRSLQKKSKDTRDGIALTIAGTVTIMVFAIWLYHMPSRQAALEMRNEQTEADEPGFSQVFDGIKTQMSNFKEELDDRGGTTTESDQNEMDLSIVSSSTSANDQVINYSFSNSADNNTAPSTTAGYGQVVKIATTTTEVKTGTSSSQNN